MQPQPRVLVADDDLEMLDIAAGIAEEHGAKVVRATNGADLIQYLAGASQFDLLITDVSMPWMSGVQAARAARNAGMQTPVIVMTALNEQRVAREVAGLGGATLFLRKPFDLDQLHSAISSLLGSADRRLA